MARHKVEISGVNTANMKVLSSKETEELFIKMKEGDPFARDDLIQGNLKLVLSLLKRFHHREENMDLFQIRIRIEKGKLVEDVIKNGTF